MSMHDIYYILEGTKTRPEPDRMAWALWMNEFENRVVQQTTIGDVFVSTVFLGIDHSLLGNGPPILFETLVNGGNYYDNEIVERYTTYEDAERGHRRIVSSVLSVT